jgi:ATP-dependent DNA helicase RecG
MLIAQVFYDLNLIERYGSGIQRILGACRDAGLPEPLFEDFSGGFRIRFAQSKSDAPQVTPPMKGDEGLNEGLNEGLKSLLAAIRENPGVQAKELEKILARPIKTIERQVKTLTDLSRIERRGSKKTGGYYEVAD